MRIASVKFTRHDLFVVLMILHWSIPFPLTASDAFLIPALKCAGTNASTRVTLETVPLFQPLELNIKRGDSLIVNYGTSHRSAPNREYKFEIVAQNDKRRAVLVSKRLVSNAGWNQIEHKIPGKWRGKTKFEFHVYCLDPNSGQFEKITDDSAGWGGLRVGKFRRSTHERNLVVISLDTCRVKSLSRYGAARPTSPHFDQLAKSSLDFLQASSPSSWTLPAHMSLFTGRYPSFHTMAYNGDTHFHELPLEIPLLTNTLREQGYLGVAFTGGAKLSSVFGYYRGFDWYQENLNLDTDAIVNFSDAITWVRKNKSKKFFLFLHTYEIHTPYTNKVFFEKSSSPAEELRSLYEGDINFTDIWLGKFIETMDALGLSENTIFVITSDHGEEFDERGLGLAFQHGHTLKDELVKIPLLIYAPGLLKPQKITHFQMSLVNVFPTLFDLLNVPVDPNLKNSINGKSVAGPMQTGVWPDESYAFSEITTLSPARYCVRYSTGSSVYKFTVNPTVVFPEYIPAVKRTIFGDLQEQPAITQFAAKEETRNYFDLTTDPEEKRPLALEADFPRKELDELMRGYLGRLPDLRSFVISGTLGDEEVKKNLKTLGY